MTRFSMFVVSSQNTVDKNISFPDFMKNCIPSYNDDTDVEQSWAQLAKINNEMLDLLSDTYVLPQMPKEPKSPQEPSELRDDIVDKIKNGEEFNIEDFDDLSEEEKAYYQHKKHMQTIKNALEADQPLPQNVLDTLSSVEKSYYLQSVKVNTQIKQINEKYHELPDDAPEFLKTLAKYQNDNPDSAQSEELERAQAQRELFEALTEDKKQFEQLVKLQKENPQDFAKVWQNFQKENSSDPHIIAERSIEQSNGKEVYHLKNINGTGLDLRIAQGQISVGILESEQKISPDQFQALNDYLTNTKTTITDYAQLSNIKVDFNGQEVTLDRALADYRGDDAYLEEIGVKTSSAPTKESSETTPNKDASAGRTDEGDQVFDSSQWIDNGSSKDNVHANRKKAREKELGKLTEAYGSKCIRTSVDWGGHTVRVYGSEADAREDGKIDPKTGIKKRTKMFAYRINNGNPPSAQIYPGQLADKISSKDVAPILKYAYEMGHRHFVMPPNTEITKAVFEAFLEASVTAGIVPQLKHSKDDKKGVDLNGSDVAKIKEWIDKKLVNQEVNKQINYLLLFSKELHQFANVKPEMETQSQIFEQQARFTMFNKIYKENLDSKIREACSDKIDVIAAKYAYGRILDNIFDGKIPQLDANGNLIKDGSGNIKFEAFDPRYEAKATNNEKLGKVLLAYMANEKPHILALVESKYNDLMHDNTDPNNRIADRTVDTAIREIDKKYTNGDSTIRGYNNAVEGAVGGGGCKTEQIDIKKWPEPEKRGFNPLNRSNRLSQPTASKGRSIDDDRR